jgi:membrane protein DedA with SNARE-associated domain
VQGWLEIVVNVVTGFIDKAGYGGVFLGMALESLCLPLPSEIVLVSAGFLVGQGEFSLPLALASAFAGALFGSTITYSVARFGGWPLLQRYGRYFLLTEQRLRATEIWFTKHGAKAVLLCRLVSGLRAIVSVPAGLCHMPYPKFLLYTALGSGTWVVIGILFGRFVGKEWERLSHLGHGILIGAIALLASIMIWHHFHKKRIGDKPEA